MLKKLFSHTAIYGLAPQISKIAYFLALPFITKDLSEIDFGVAGIMTAYTTAISVLASLGLNLILVNSFYRSPGHFKWGWRQIYGFLTIWNLFYALMLGFLIYAIVPQEAIKDRWMILLLNIGPLIFFGQTTVIGGLFYRVKQLPMEVAVRAALSGLINVLLSVIFIRYLKMGYMGWFWATFIVGMLTNLSYWYPLNFKHKVTPIFNFKWRYIKKSLVVSIPTIPHYYANYLMSNSDKVIMDLFKINTSDIGRYNFANIVGNVFQAISTAAGTAAGPLMNEMYKKDNDVAARNLVFVMQIAFLFMTMFVSIWSKELFLMLVKNKSLSSTYPLAIIIIMSYNYRPMYFGANTKLFYLERTKVLWKVTFIAGLTNIAMNLILIPVFGYKVGVITTFVSFMYMGYIGYYLKDFKEINTAKYYPIFWLALTLILTYLSTIIVEFHFAIKIIISIVIIISAIIGIMKTNRKAI